MTPQRRKPNPDAARLRFLLGPFLADLPDTSPDAMVATPPKLLDATVRRLVPGPLRGAYSMSQLAVMGLSEAEFTALRFEVRDLLRRLVAHVPVQQVSLAGPLALTLSRVPTQPGRMHVPAVEGPARSVAWLYIAQVISRVGVGQIGVCRAPQSSRDGDAHEHCGRLFLRRGAAKRFCSPQCRIRVATQAMRRRQAKEEGR